MNAKLEKQLEELQERLNSEVAKWVVEARTKKQIGPTALAEATGLTRNYIWSIQNGKAENLSLDAAVKIALYLGKNLGPIIKN